MTEFVNCQANRNYMQIEWPFSNTLDVGIQHPAIDINPDFIQRVINAGPADAASIFNSEECAVSAAMDKRIIHIEKLVRQPFETDTGMGAAVAVAVKLAIFVHNENH